MTIHILPPELANQIAAGEVVERPASIIKELVENCIDAGATQIDIDIEQGGCKLIRIRDNGCGISKSELALALARHATSKITNLDDLEAIVSLGFRGEALASISSVSRLTLTSRPQSQTDAWQVYAEGREMTPIIKPASHPVGTTVEVLDIFYNTPARRRFLKTEKTEFSHIDEVIRRIALAYPNIAFNFQHNGKLVKQYRVSQSSDPIDKRIATVCGTTFMQKAIKLSWQHDNLSINGWIVAKTTQEPMQYFYVNGRIVKDRLLNHALKQAFQERNKSSIHSTDQTLSYIIYLEVDPHQVDVNVHPAKHEVRFHESRLVHDFVHQAVVMALQQIEQQTEQLKESTLPVNLTEPLYGNHLDYKNENRMAAGRSVFDKRFEKNESVKQNGYANYIDKSQVKKNDHLNENKIYGRLIQQPSANYSGVDTSISQEQQAVIDSLFPKRDDSLVIPKNEIKVSSATQLGKVLAIVNNEYALLEKSQQQQQQFSLLSLKKAQLILLNAELLEKDKTPNIERLLIPLSMLLNNEEQQVMIQYQKVFEEFSFEFEIERSKFLLMAVPKLMRKANWQKIIPSLIKFLSKENGAIINNQEIMKWLCDHYINSDEYSQILWNIPKAIQLLSELEELDPQSYDPCEIIKSLDSLSFIELFK